MSAEPHRGGHLHPRRDADEGSSYEEYHPYGTTAWQAPGLVSVSLKRYKYTGMERDEETGLQRHGVRYYATWLGRWTSADPIGLGDGGNRYCYCHGGPVDGRDPAGLFDVPDPQALANQATDAYDRASNAVHASLAEREAGVMAGLTTAKVELSIQSEAFAYGFVGEGFNIAAKHVLGPIETMSMNHGPQGHMASEAAYELGGAANWAGGVLGREDARHGGGAAARFVAIGLLVGSSLAGLAEAGAAPVETTAMAEEGFGPLQTRMFRFLPRPTIIMPDPPAAGLYDVASEGAGETASLWRAPKVGRGELESGYSALNHPRDVFNDGNAYFAGPESRSLAEEYARHGPYEDGVLEVRIPKADYAEHFSPLERLYQGGPRTEVPVPQEMFDRLNTYGRFFHPTGG